MNAAVLGLLTNGAVMLLAGGYGCWLWRNGFRTMGAVSVFMSGLNSVFVVRDVVVIVRGLW